MTTTELRALMAAATPRIYEVDGVTHVDVINADATVALFDVLPELLDKADKWDALMLQKEWEQYSESPEWLHKYMERIREHGRVNDPREAND